MLDASEKHERPERPGEPAADRDEADARLLADLDRDRLIWDPEYRAEVSRALARRRYATPD